MNEATKDGEHGVTDGLFAIAKALDGVARELRGLGNGNASSPQGAIEAFGMHVGAKLEDGLAQIAAAISDAGDAMSGAER